MSSTPSAAAETFIQDIKQTRNAEVLTLSPHPVTGRLIDSHPGVRTQPMQVLVLGASRTGTVSIMTALEQLGYNQYHMAKAMKTPKLSFALWIEALQAKFNGIGQPWGRAEFDKILGDYNGVSDVPTICFAEELIAAYPDAKIVLSTRDVDAWLRSMDSTAGHCLRWRGWATLAKWDPALVGPWWEHGKIVCPAAYDTLSDFSPQGPARAAFHAHYARVRAAAPKERLLEYDVKQGWGPLCQFLGKEVPEGEFPRANDSKEFVRIHGFMWWLAASRMVGTIAVMGAPVVAVAAAVWWRGEVVEIARKWLA